MLLDGCVIRYNNFKYGDKIAGVRRREDELRQLVTQGLSAKKLAKHFNVSADTIYQVCKERGLVLQLTSHNKWGQYKEKLLAMLRQGMSRGQIANELGATRNAIIGACTRLGLNKDAQVQKQIAANRREADKKFAADNRTRKRAKGNKRTPPQQHQPPALLDSESATKRTLMELGLGHCRFPTYDKFYCGAATEADLSSWCPYHAQIVFQNHRSPRSGVVGGSPAVASRTGVESPCSPANAARPHQSLPQKEAA